MNRRDFLTAVAATGIATATSLQAQAPPAAPAIKRKGRIKQSLFRTVFGQNTPGLTTLDEHCREAARLGAYGFELIPPAEWPTLKKYGLVPTMAPMSFTTIPDGIVHKEQHDALEKALKSAVDVCAAGGCEKIITFGGQRKGMSYEEGMDNCATFLNRVKGYLEDKRVTICVENTNSKYQTTSSAVPISWPTMRHGASSCAGGSTHRASDAVRHLPAVRTETSRRPSGRFQWIAHFHRGSARAPRARRHAGAELSLRRADVADLGYAGYVAHVPADAGAGSDQGSRSRDGNPRCIGSASCSRSADL